MNIQIVNIREVHWDKGLNRINEIGIEYVGRPSVLGNKFRILKDVPRARVIQKYKRWLWDKIKSRDKKVIDELTRLKAIAVSGELVLGCWCTPKACHADIIKAAIEWSINKGGLK